MAESKLPVSRIEEIGLSGIAGKGPKKRPQKASANRRFSPSRFVDKVTIVVGGAQGIGKAIAMRLAAEGAMVAIADIDRVRMAATVSEIKAGKGQVLGLLCDVRKKRQVDRVVETVIRTWKRIDVLIYVAGVSKGIPFVETTDEIWDWTININLKGAFWFARGVVRHMIKRRYGKMVFMASTNAWDAEANLAPYNVSKAGLFLLAKTLARELGSYGICSNAVAPGLIRTRLTKPFLKDPKFMKKYSNLIPLGRVGVPDDVAGAAVFLASSDADYITGSMLFVDGGQLA
jgi:NAD(P)-dependent dehydrogenase (short-subunit alcohol dehydrogenase family)